MSQSLEDVFATPIGDMRSVGDAFATPIGDMKEQSAPALSEEDREQLEALAGEYTAEVAALEANGTQFDRPSESILKQLEDADRTHQLDGGRGLTELGVGAATYPVTNHLIGKPVANAVTKGAARIAPKMLGKIFGSVAGLGTGGLASAGLGIAAGEGLDYLAKKYPDQTNAVLDAISNPNKGLPPPTSHSDMVFPFAPDGAEHSIIQNPDDMRQDSSSTGVLATPPNLVR